MKQERPGRPGSYRWGVDLGGTKTEAILLNPQGQAIWGQRVPTPRGHYQATLHQIGALLQAARQAHPRARGTVQERDGSAKRQGNADRRRPDRRQVAARTLDRNLSRAGAIRYHNWMPK